MSWSYSKLLDFEQCPYRYRLKHVDRVPEEKSPAADRGTAIHQMAEDFTKGSMKSLPTELLKFDNEFLILHREYASGRVSVEGEWGFNADWEPAPYKTAWLRMKADAVVFNENKTRAVVVDFKTGKKWGNEIKHGEQVQLYGLAVALREPTVKKIVVELWYLDKDDLTRQDYTREHAISFIKPFNQRAVRIDKAHAADKFPPNPNAFSCQWCPYGPNKGKQCEYGIRGDGTGAMSIADYRKRFV